MKKILKKLLPRIQTSQKGFTLVELILYIALVSIFITGAIMFSWDIVYGREKSFQQQIVEQESRTIMARIAYEINRASAINALSSSSITLETGVNDTIITLDGDVIKITSNGAGPYNLSSNQASVTELSFSDMSSTDHNAKNILVQLQVDQAASTNSEQFSASTVLEQTVELDNQFNSARKLLIDWSGTIVSNNGKELGNTPITNTSDSTIVIDKMYIEWTGGESGSVFQELQIDGDPREWNSNVVSGTLVDIVNVSLDSVQERSIEKIGFSSDMGGAELIIHFIMLDGSISKSEFRVNPTDLVPDPGELTCNLYCQSLLYTGGTCRKNAKACTDNGEVRQSNGNQYCTGGNNADTCCCLP